MTPKVSILTSTFREGWHYAQQADALAHQTFKDFEWVIVDDLAGARRWVPPSGWVRHIPPREPKDIFAAASSWNAGLAWCRGELVYFMNDYVVPSSDCLEAHWDAYQRYEGKAIFSGPSFGTQGGSAPEPRDNHLEDETGCWEHIRRWWWAGRNDSAPLKYLLEANGFDERLDGAHGGQDVELAARLVRLGCQYIILKKGATYEWPHPVSHKKQPGQAAHWLTLFKDHENGGGNYVAPNSWNIAAERQKNLSV